MIYLEEFSRSLEFPLQHHFYWLSRIPLPLCMIMCSFSHMLLDICVVYHFFFGHSKQSCDHIRVAKSLCTFMIIS